MSTHLLLQGGWAECPAPSACELKFHFEMTPAEATAMPTHVLYPLLEVMDPPSQVDFDGRRYWDDEEGMTHRDYDLPAMIVPGRVHFWRKHGLLHRDGGKPAVIYLQEQGAEQYWVEGEQL